MMTATDNELSALDPEWQRYAVQLARLRLPFVVNGLNHALDAPFCRAISEKFNLDAKFDLPAAKVQFTPGN